MRGSGISQEDLDWVEHRLGRPPRGLREIAARNAEGRPAVIRVASVVNSKPFPTLYWLIDPEISLRIDREEAGGTIATIQQQINANPTLQSKLIDDHRRHIERRASYISQTEKNQLVSQSQWSALSERGVGGIADFTRVRCLHTWYAAHLVESNSIGRLVDERWAKSLAPGQADTLATSGTQP